MEGFARGEAPGHVGAVAYAAALVDLGLFGGRTLRREEGVGLEGDGVVGGQLDGAQGGQLEGRAMLAGVSRASAKWSRAKAGHADARARTR